MTFLGAYDRHIYKSLCKRLCKLYQQKEELESKEVGHSESVVSSANARSINVDSIQYTIRRIKKRIKRYLQRKKYRNKVSRLRKRKKPLSKHEELINSIYQPYFDNGVSHFKILTWNVRTLRGEEDMLEFLDCMQEGHYNVGIVSETHIQNVPLEGIRYRLPSGKTYYFLGHGNRVDDKPYGGVGIVLSAKLYRARIQSPLEALELCSERMTLVCLQIGTHTYSIISIYAPTNADITLLKSMEKIQSKEERLHCERRKIFYSDVLDPLLNCISKFSHIIMGGDFNARIGDDIREVTGTFDEEEKKLYDKALGNYCNVSDSGHSQSNENGWLLADFCLVHQLAVVSTHFPVSGTWLCNINKVAYKIDHILVRQVDLPSVLECQVSHDIFHRSCDRRPLHKRNTYDHYPLSTIIDWKLLEKKKITSNLKRKFTPKQEKINIDKLRALQIEDVKSIFTVVDSKLDELFPRSDNNTTGDIVSSDLDHVNKNIIDGIFQIAKALKVVDHGIKPVKQNDWFIGHEQELEAARLEMNSRYSTYMSSAVNKIDRDQMLYREFVNSRKFYRKLRNRIRADFLRIQQEKHESLHINDAWGYFRSIERYKNRHRCTSKLFAAGIQDSNGKAHTDMDTVFQLLSNHCTNLFSNDRVINLVEVEKHVRDVWNQETLPHNVDIVKYRDILHQNFTSEEISVALSLLGNRKSPGSDGFPAEIFKILASARFIDVITSFFNLCLHSGNIPHQFKESIIILLFKKGDKTLCDNYRTISLLNTLTKWLMKTLMIRLTNYLEAMSIFGIQPNKFNIIPENQYAFRSNRCREEAIFLLDTLLKDHWSANVDLFLVFIDLKKAYDYVSREILWLILKILNVPPIFINLLKCLHDGSFARLRVNGIYSDILILLNSGLKQGCNGATLFFNIFFAAIFAIVHKKLSNIGVDYIVLRIEDKRPLQKEMVHIGDLMFADDVNIACNTVAETQTYIDVLDQITILFGMCISDVKTEIMPQYSRTSKLVNEPIFTLPSTGRVLKNVKYFKYLGAMCMSFRPSLQSKDHIDVMEKEVARRISLAQWQFHEWSDILLLKSKKLLERVNLFKTYVVSILTQSIGARVFTQSHIDKLEHCYYTMLRKILRWPFKNLKSRWFMYKQCHVMPFSCLYDQAVLRFAKFLREKDCYSLSRTMFCERNELHRQYINGSIVPGTKIPVYCPISYAIQSTYKSQGGRSLLQQATFVIVKIGLAPQHFSGITDTNERCMKALIYPYDIWEDWTSELSDIDTAIKVMGDILIEDNIVQSQIRDVIDPHRKEYLIKNMEEKEKIAKEKKKKKKETKCLAISKEISKEKKKTTKKTVTTTDDTLSSLPSSSVTTRSGRKVIPRKPFDDP
jgi:hypothetical protein